MKIGSRVLDYGSMHLLGPHDPNIVSGPQNPKSKKFLRFHNFFLQSTYDSDENEVLFVKI